MLIRHVKPKIWFLVKFFFPSADWNGTIVTFGRTTHCKEQLTDTLVAHELVHQNQQRRNAVVASVWWFFYIIFPPFRFWQEIAAHRAEWQSCKILMSDRNQLAYFRDAIAKRLSGPLYGNMVSYRKAYLMIDQ